MKTRTTIHDVARLAGVSKVTVSYVLNDRCVDARISEATATKVRAAAQALNYSPNAIAKTLATRQSRTIGVVFQSGVFFSQGSSFTGELMRGVCAGAVANGYDLMLHTSPVQSPREELNRLCDGRIDGVLVLRDQGDELLEGLLKAKIPCVQFFTRCDDPDAYWLDTDNFLGGRMAAEHLLSLGHTRLGMIGGPEGSIAAQQRRQGFEAALRDAGVQIDRKNFISAPDPTSPLEGVAEMLGRSGRPTGLFVWSDDVALAAWPLFASLGLSVPNDLSVIGFDSSPACERSSPPLTSIQQPIYAIATSATEVLILAIEKKITDGMQKVYSPTLEARGSTAQAPISVSAEVR